MSMLKIAQLQLPVPSKKEKALDQARQYCIQAARMGASLVMLPEMFCCPYEVQNFPLYAEEEKGPVWQSCSEIARESSVYLCAGSFPERNSQGQIFNTSYVFDPSGKQIARHRKMHLFDIDVRGGQSFRESATLTPGDDITVFDTPFGPLGLCICYDFRFPELGRLMALQGARVILVPAAFNMTTGPLHWELTFRSQAVSNQVFALGTAPARDLSASYHSWGHSIAVDPWGKVLAQMDEKAGVQFVELDLSLVDQVREQLPLLRHRREDLYSLRLVH